MDNKINFTIPDELVNEAIQGATDLSETFKPYLIALTPEERHDLLKMNDKTIPFVNKTMEYVATAPQFVPPYMDTTAMANDLKVYNQLIPLLRLTKRLLNGFDDTIMAAGSESYSHALQYYNSVKQAAKLDVPGAKVIYEDLSKRFERKRAKTEDQDIE